MKATGREMVCGIVFGLVLGAWVQGVGILAGEPTLGWVALIWGGAGVGCGAYGYLRREDRWWNATLSIAAGIGVVIGSAGLLAGAGGSGLLEVAGGLPFVAVYVGVARALGVGLGKVVRRPLAAGQR